MPIKEIFSKYKLYTMLCIITLVLIAGGVTLGVTLSKDTEQPVKADAVYVYDDYGNEYYFETSGDTAELVYGNIYEPYTEVVIPSTIEDDWGNQYTVTSIASYALSWYEISSLSIPDSVTDIGEGAFSYCENLETVTIGEGVNNIWNNAFEGCTSLTSVTIPYNVFYIGDYAFFNCSSLEFASIGNRVFYIGESAFEGCENLSFIIFNYTSSSVYDDNYNSHEIEIGANSFMCADSMACYFENEGIMNYVLNNYGSAFSDTSDFQLNRFTTYITADGVECSSSNYDFSISYKLLSSQTCTIEVVMRGNSSATSIIIPEMVSDNSFIVEEISMRYRAEIGVFYHSYVTNIILPDTLKRIVGSAFYASDNLETITIGSGLTSIQGAHAFRACPLTTINVSADNPNFKDIDGVMYSKDGKTIVAYPRGRDATTYAIEPNSTAIGDYAFRYCNRLTSIEIPDSVTSIGDCAFDSCTSLTSIKIPDKVTSIGDGTFNYCSDLTSITIPNSVISIGDSAFDSCSGLTSITIPDSVTSIGGTAFSSCSGLTSITIPDSVVQIGDYVFPNCSNLRTVTIGKNVATMGYQLFSGCTNLTTIYFYNDISSVSSTIGSSAFRGTSSSARYYFKDQTSLNNASNYHSYKFANSNFQLMTLNTSITVQSSNESYGTVSDSTGSYAVGSSVVIGAYPRDNYEFLGWSLNGGNTIISGTENQTSYVVNVTSDATYTAVFRLKNYTITTSTDGNGTISATASSVQSGGSVTVTATPSSSSYEFDYFIVNNGSPIYTNPYTVTNITQNTTITAYFKLKTYTITTNTDGNGSITASATVSHGGSFQVTATPNASYLFDYFILNNDTSNPITTNPYTIENITQNTTIVAYFKRAYAQTTATAGGEVRVTGNNLGAEHTSESVSYTAIPYTNYYLIGWFIDGVLYTQNGATVIDKTITLSQAQAQGAWVVPVFSTNPNEAPALNTTLENTTAVNSTIGGEARMVGLDNTDTQATLIAKVDDNYRFIGWYDGETLLGTDLSIRLNLSAIQNKIIIARFEPITTNSNDQTDSGNIDIL